MKDPFKDFVFPSEEEINKDTHRAKLSIRGKEQWERTVSDPESLANWRTKTVDNPEWKKKVAKENTIRSKGEKWRAGMDRRTEKIRNSQEWKDNIAESNRKMVKTEEWKTAYLKGIKNRKFDKDLLSAAGKKAHTPEADRKRMISAGILPFRCPWGVYMSRRDASRQSLELYGAHVRYEILNKRLKKLDKPERNEGYNFISWEEYDELTK
jgi:hypothetical protein